MTTWDRLLASDEEAVRAMVLGLYQASSTANLAFFDSHFRHLEGLPRQPGPDESVFIGTDPAEFWVGHTMIRDKWSQIFTDMEAAGYLGGGLPIDPGTEMIISGMKLPESSSTYVTALPYPVAVAWVADQPLLRLHTQYPCRFTALLVYMSNSQQWLFAQAHLSIGKPNGDLDI